MPQVLRGPSGSLSEACPEVRYEVVHALLRGSLCLAAAVLVMATAPGGERAALANLAVGLASLVAAVAVSGVTSAEGACRFGRWSTGADLVLLVLYQALFHDQPGANGLFPVFVLIEGPLRYGARGLLVTGVPVAVICAVMPQVDPAGSQLSAPQVALLCLAFTLPVVAVRSLLKRGDGRLRQVEQMLVHQAGHDPLTGLPNRLHALRALDAALQEEQVVAVLFLDLDRFKVVNDGMGHAAGDLVLQQVAARLREVMRGEDLVARLGGDEFVVLCRDADAENAEVVAARVLEALKTPVTSAKGLDLVIGASIGIAVGKGDQTAEMLLADADAAMYAAKDAGGGRARHFSADLRAALVRSHELERELRLALRHQGLSLVYQPMFDLATGMLTGCEALVRWDDPHRGPVPPDEFVALAEQSDLILELGEWVLRHALADADEWPGTSAGYAPSVSVNVSLRQLVAAGFTQQVRELLRTSGIDPARLCLEVTETVLADDVAPVIEVLHQLRGIGVRLSIDDFGTGHASLTYLARFPVDQVKVDRTFVAGLGVDAGSDAIVGGVVAMAHTFDLRVVAEGVETDQQLEHLRAMGCDAAQGFLLARPLGQQALLRALSTRHARLQVPAPRDGSAPCGPDPVSEQDASPYRLLVEGAREVTRRVELSEVLDQSLAALGRFVSFAGGAILLVEDGQVRVAARRPGPSAVASTGGFPVGQGVCGAIALTGEPRYLPDIALAATGTEGRGVLASPGARSWFGVPLISQGRPVGVLQVDSTAVDAFDQRDRLAVLAFAPIVTLAVACARQAAGQQDPVPLEATTA